MVVDNTAVKSSNVEKNEDVTCWNCFTVNMENEPKKEMTLAAIRKDYRQRLKLYSFVAQEISKPKAVPLKQKVSTNYAIAKTIDAEVRKNNNSPNQEDLATKKNKRQISNESYPEFPVKVLNKIQIETSPSTEDITKLHYSTIVDMKNKDSIVELSSSPTEMLDEKPEGEDNGSESGYTGSSDHNEVTSHKSDEADDNVLIRKSLPEIELKQDLQYHDFKRSMPALNSNNASSPKSAISSSSLIRDSNLNKMTKTIRWSTASFPIKPIYFGDDVYISERPTLSPGHATLPRRSNSPLPHERDLEKDRFPLNRSGLQARSESMASVYSGAGEGTRGTVTVKGEVQFSLLYNYRLGALEVGVRRCRDLASVDIKKNRSDPYVKVYLLPDKSKTGKRKTKVKKNTLNPVFEETLSFVQPLATLSSRTLWLSVWHADMFGRNDFLGEVTLPLADVVFDDPAPMWYKLQERTEFDEQQSTRGDLIIGLKFELQETSGNHSRSKGTLHVLVKEAKNLVATKPNGLADVFCKSYLLPERGRLAKQKTGVSRRTLSPRWEHTFTYRGVTLQELSTRALELSLWDRDRLASNDFMGAVRLSLGTGTYMGASVNWMDSVAKEVTLWQTMMQRPNFWVEGSLPLRPQLNN